MTERNYHTVIIEAVLLAHVDIVMIINVYSYRWCGQILSLLAVALVFVIIQQ